MFFLLTVRLKQIAYSGDNIGNDLSFQFNVKGHGTLLKSKISLGQRGLFDKVLLQEIFPKGSHSLPIRVEITEEDPAFNDTGSASSRFTMQLEQPETRTHSFSADVIARGGDKAKKATFTFIMEVIVNILKVELKDGTTVINEGEYAYITGAPQMPQLKASVKPAGLFGNARWRLYIEYTRPDRGSYTGDKEYYLGPDASTWKTLSASATWDIAAEFGTDFRGGKATLSCEYQGVQGEQVFHIRGNNPTEVEAKAYLDANGPWFAYCIAKHESGTQSGRTYLQFNELGTLGPNPADYKYCPNRGAGGAPYGWGMMQLDNIELPGQTSYRQPDNGDPWAQELWSWKANCDTAIQVLARKREMAIADLKDIAPDGAGGYIMPSDIIVSGVSFTGGGPHTPDQLETIKKYNGGKFWTAYDAEAGEWTHIPLKSQGAPDKDYTEKVLDEY